jgi:cysteinyl-tRNA synthetase
MYGHHRKRINFTPMSFRKVTKKLDQLKEALREILSVSPSANAPAASDNHADELIAALPRRFELRMNDDLDVGRAFDEVSADLARLLVIKRKGRLGTDNFSKIDRHMRRIDSVFQVIFPL